MEIGEKHTDILGAEGSMADPIIVITEIFYWLLG